MYFFLSTDLSITEYKHISTIDSSFIRKYSYHIFAVSWFHRWSLCPWLAQNPWMFHAQADLSHFGSQANLEWKILIFPVAQPQAGRPVLAPHVQVSTWVDGSIRTQSALDGRHHDVRIELVAAKEGGRQEGGFHRLVQVGAFAQDAVTPDKHVMVFWKRQLIFQVFKDATRIESTPVWQKNLWFSKIYHLIGFHYAPLDH